MLSSMKFGAGTGPYSIAILVPDRNFNKNFIVEHYIKALEKKGINPEQIIAFNLQYESTGKAPVGRCIRPWLEQLAPILEKLNIRFLLCCDGPYFKSITRVGKVDPHLGYAKPTYWDTSLLCFYVPNAAGLFRDPRIQSKMDLGLEALSLQFSGNGNYFAEDIIKFGRYAIDIDEQFKWLNSNGKLHKFSALTCDIETSGLALGSKLLSIAFGMDQHSGIVLPFANKRDTRALVKKFLTEFKGTLIWQKGTFDTKHLIWNLWMKDTSDFDGMLAGLAALHKQGKYEDTHTLSYLATNSCSGNDLSLKAQAFEFVGNYALGAVANLEMLPIATVLTYNLRDALATWYVYNKHSSVVRDTQETVYRDIFLPSLRTITQMEMVGIPLNPGQVLATEFELLSIQKTHMEFIEEHQVTKDLNWVLRTVKAKQDTAKLKTKIKTASDYELSLSFNPGSPKQLQCLLHDLLKLPINSTTDTGQPSTDIKALKAHVAYLENNGDPHNAKDLIQAIIAWSEVSKMTSTFIPAFKEKVIERSGWNYLVGNFTMGGTKSGRQSSSDPNLQNIPSTGTSYAKVIKQCVQAPAFIGNNPGWLYVGADYASLEDRIGALISRDPNKLAVYTDGYDGHSLRAASYFPDRMPDIREELLRAINALQRVEIINSIADRYPKLRQLSKGPTFALTYLGTWKTLVQNFGLTRQEAEQIEANYHELYRVADEWAQAQMYKAHLNGYVELAFGLRLRTPCLTQVFWEDESSWPFEAYKEKKTATNALGQSYGLLNTHTSNLFMQRVWNSPYAISILPSAHIHDAQYYLVRNNLDTLHWLNINLIQCMTENTLPELQHDVVKLEAQLEVFYPNWANSLAIPVNAAKEQIREILWK